MRLLLAEDTRDLNHAVATVLQMQGYDVDTAYDGEEALELFRNNGYDGMILDIMMPKKDGLEVLAEVRRHDTTVPVIMLTAKAEIEDRVAGLDAGADDYLPKPFAMKELLARVRALARRSQIYINEDICFGDLRLKRESLELDAESSVRLSVKEFTLLRHLLLHADRPQSAAQMLQAVWGPEEKADGDTLWLYIHYLQGKLKGVGSQVRILEQDEAYIIEEGDSHG